MMPLPRLHILTDTVIQQRHSHLALAENAFLAGAVAVQYRNKAFDPRFHLEELQEIARLARQLGRLLIVNDDPHLAKAVGAGGVHVGREDTSVEKARAVLGPQAVVGATVHSLAELEALRGQAVDYFGIGPVFGSKTKDTGLPPLGLEGLQALAARAWKPVIAIGSIDLENLSAVMQTGVHGIAVISAYCSADDLHARASQLLERLQPPA